eukprot:gene9367-biopygen19724
MRCDVTRCDAIRGMAAVCVYPSAAAKAHIERHTEASPAVPPDPGRARPCPLVPWPCRGLDGRVLVAVACAVGGRRSSVAIGAAWCRLVAPRVARLPLCRPRRAVAVAGGRSAGLRAAGVNGHSTTLTEEGGLDGGGRGSLVLLPTQLRSHALYRFFLYSGGNRETFAQAEIGKNLRRR